MLEVVAAMIKDGHGKFMICRRPENKARALQWEFPGGKIEKGETAEEALMRECREEMDIEIACEAEYMDLIHEYPDITVHLHLIPCRIVRGEPKKIEHSDICWIDISQADGFDFCPADRIFIERMKMHAEKG